MHILAAISTYYNVLETRRFRGRFLGESKKWKKRLCVCMSFIFFVSYGNPSIFLTFFSGFIRKKTMGLVGGKTILKIYGTLLALRLRKRYNVHAFPLSNEHHFTPLLSN